MTTKQIVMAGLKWPPDVGAQTYGEAVSDLFSGRSGREATYDESEQDTEGVGRADLEHGREDGNAYRVAEKEIRGGADT